jgi:hypothetical protein
MIKHKKLRFYSKEREAAVYPVYKFSNITWEGSKSYPWHDHRPLIISDISVFIWQAFFDIRWKLLSPFYSISVRIRQKRRLKLLQDVTFVQVVDVPPNYPKWVTEDGVRFLDPDTIPDFWEGPYPSFETFNDYLDELERKYPDPCIPYKNSKPIKLELV